MNLSSKATFLLQDKYFVAIRQNILYNNKILCIDKTFCSNNMCSVFVDF